MRSPNLEMWSRCAVDAPAAPRARARLMRTHSDMLHARASAAPRSTRAFVMLTLPLPACAIGVWPR